VSERFEHNAVFADTCDIKKPRSLQRRPSRRIGLKLGPVAVYGAKDRIGNELREILVRQVKRHFLGSYRRPLRRQFSLLAVLAEAGFLFVGLRGKRPYLTMAGTWVVS